MYKGVSNAEWGERAGKVISIEMFKRAEGEWDGNPANELFPGVLVYIQDVIWSTINAHLYKLRKCQSSLLQYSLTREKQSRKISEQWVTLK